MTTITLGVVLIVTMIVSTLSVFLFSNLERRTYGKASEVFEQLTWFFIALLIVSAFLTWLHGEAFSDAWDDNMAEACYVRYQTKEFDVNPDGMVDCQVGEFEWVSLDIPRMDLRPDDIVLLEIGEE